ncbi:hypothetical protein DRE_05071 [Drechslerella stenobrocha 248]|uniref:Uncharacterized protein n=1 Tax=Drechslerella stenobrocha 248 TaxID=1043628 RepID=W7HRD2_9PEZI|nr:hypothetical protein DRE_05071 [Drechslerella stenobrocha 248]
MKEEDAALTSADAVRKGPSLLSTALAIGAVTGSCGGFVGAIVATLKNHPRKGVYVVGTAVNCFIVGSGFYATRETLSQNMYARNQMQPIPPNDRIILSGAAAATVGGIWGSIIGVRSHAIPGLLVFGAAGISGQAILNRIAANKDIRREDHEGAKEPEASILSRILSSENSPVRKLSQQEYIDKLREKQLYIDAEIALIDEEIEELRLKLKEEDPGGTKKRSS